MEITLKKPVTYCGKTYDTISLDLDSLTGGDLMAAAQEAGMLAEATIPVLVLDMNYQVCVAARAAKLPSDLFRALPAKAFSQITLAVQRFLTESD